MLFRPVTYQAASSRNVLFRPPWCGMGSKHALHKPVNTKSQCQLKLQK